MGLIRFNCRSRHLSRKNRNRLRWSRDGERCFLPAKALGNPAKTTETDQHHCRGRRQGRCADFYLFAAPTFITKSLETGVVVVQTQVSKGEGVQPDIQRKTGEGESFLPTVPADARTVIRGVREARSERIRINVSLRSAVVPPPRLNVPRKTCLSFNFNEKSSS